MVQTSGTASGLLRVTVSSGNRRVDLVLPGIVPVAELVPELARSVGLLDATSVHGGYRLLRGDGHRLSPETGLLVQGVEDGGLLTIAAGADDPTPLVYDDLADAMADVVADELSPWTPERARRTALVGGAIMLGLSAVGCWTLVGNDVVGVAAALAAAVLVVVAAVLDRVEGVPAAGSVVALAATGFGLVSGSMLAADPPFAPGNLLWASVGAGLTGLACTVVLRDGRGMVLPAVLVAGVGVACGILVGPLDLDPLVVLPCVLVLVVFLGSALPTVALALTPSRVDPQAMGEPGAGVDTELLREDARTAHELMIAMSAAVGALVVLVAPVAVASGGAGAALAVLCCLVLVLRSRRHTAASGVLVGLVSALVGVAVTTLAVLVMHPDWREATAVALAAAAVLLLSGLLVEWAPSVRRARTADLTESAALVALLPVLAFSTGLVERIAG